MYLDGINVYSLGSWRRAVLHTYTGTAWSISPVYALEGNYSVEYNDYNLNAKSVTKTYKPVWWAQYNDELQYFDRVSGSDGSGAFKVGRWYDTNANFSTFVAFPKSQIISDSFGKFGIAKIEMVSTLLDVGGHGFGRCELYSSDISVKPNLYDSHPYANNQYMNYFMINMTDFDSGFFNENYQIFESILNNDVSVFNLVGEYYDTRVCFEVKDVKFVVTWASKL